MKHFTTSFLRVLRCFISNWGTGKKGWKKWKKSNGRILDKVVWETNLWNGIRTTVRFSFRLLFLLIDCICYQWIEGSKLKDAFSRAFLKLFDDESLEWNFRKESHTARHENTFGNQGLSLCYFTEQLIVVLCGSNWRSFFSVVYPDVLKSHGEKVHGNLCSFGFSLLVFFTKTILEILELIWNVW